MTTNYGSATVALPSDNEILITRNFEAPLRSTYGSAARGAT